VSDCGTNLALDVVANNWDASSCELVSPLFGTSNENWKRIYETNASINCTLSVELRSIFRTNW
jgi:hypothetical protein